MILEDIYTLTNGVEISKIGLGAWSIEDHKAAELYR